MGCKHLAEALKINTSLGTLELSFNNIGENGCKHFAEALKINTGLTALLLDDNNIGDQGCEHFAEALNVNTSLTTLTLGSNNIGDEGCEALVVVLKMPRCLTHLWGLDLTDYASELGLDLSLATKGDLYGNKALLAAVKDKNEEGDGNKRPAAKMETVSEIEPELETLNTTLAGSERSEKKPKVSLQEALVGYLGRSEVCGGSTFLEGPVSATVAR